MKARVFVTLKPSVFDPQGRTVVEALHSLGHTKVGDVRQGKYFELDLATTALVHTIRDNRAAIEGQKVRLAGVDEHVVLRGRGARKQREQLAARELFVFERQKALAVLDVAVTAVEQ